MTMLSRYRQKRRLGYVPGDTIEYVDQETFISLAIGAVSPEDGPWWERGIYIGPAKDVGRSYHMVKRSKGREKGQFITVPARRLRVVGREPRPVRKIAPRIPGATVEERFWAKVDKDGPAHPYNKRFGKCWTWTASTFAKRGGYGQFNVAPGDPRYAHRVALEFAGAKGKFEGCHGCDNPKCVRVAPGHVYAGTHRSNMGEMGKRLRSGRIKLTVEQVHEIRQRAAMGENAESIARSFDISRSNIWFIRKNRTWKHVEKRPKVVDARKAKS